MPNLHLCVRIISALSVSASAIAQDAPPKLPARPISAPINNCLAVTYPNAALKEEAEGSTHVLFTVLPTGAVTDVAILKASGLTPAHQALDKSAVKAIAGCVFAEAPGFGPREVLQRIVWQLETSVEASSGTIEKVTSPSIERSSSGRPAAPPQVER